MTLYLSALKSNGKPYANEKTVRKAWESGVSFWVINFEYPSCYLRKEQFEADDNITAVEISYTTRLKRLRIEKENKKVEVNN